MLVEVVVVAEKRLVQVTLDLLLNWTKLNNE